MNNIATNNHWFSKPLGIECIKLKPQHYAGLAGLLSHPKVAPNLWHTLSYEEWLNVLAAWGADPFVYCLVVTSNNGNNNENPIGFLRIKRWQHKKRRHCGLIGPVAVCPNNWRRGIGTILLKDSLEVCSQAGISRVDLAVQEDSPAMIRLAEKCGFVREGFQRQALDKDEDNYLGLILYGYLQNVNSVDVADDEKKR